MAEPDRSSTDGTPENENEADSGTQNEGGNSNEENGDQDNEADQSGGQGSPLASGGPDGALNTNYDSSDGAIPVHRCERCDNYETLSRAALLTHLSRCTGNEGEASAPSETHRGHDRKIFECDVCNMKFSNGANMRRHKMRHTGVKPYECRVCQKRFFRKDHLAEHFTTHTKTLPYHCPICNRGFQRQIAMRAHFQNEHVGQNDMIKSCPLCSYRAGSMKSLRVHFFNRHGIDLDNPGPSTPTASSLLQGSHCSPLEVSCNLNLAAATYSDSGDSMGARSIDNATPPMHFLTPHVEISMADAPASFSPAQCEQPLGGNSQSSSEPSSQRVNGECPGSPHSVDSNSNAPSSSHTIGGGNSGGTSSARELEVATTITPSISLIPIKQEPGSGTDEPSQRSNGPVNLSTARALASAPAESNNNVQFQSATSSSLTSLIKVSPLKSLLRDDLKRKIGNRSNSSSIPARGRPSTASPRPESSFSLQPIATTTNGTITSTGPEQPSDSTDSSEPDFAWTMADISLLSNSSHIPDILITMSYGPVLDSSSFAKAWLNDKNLGPFIDGAFRETSSPEFEVYEGCSTTIITKVRESSEDDVNTAVSSALKAADAWSKLSAHQRARHLYSLARHLQKHDTILAQMESLNRGVQSRDPKEFDVPIMVRYFYHYAGWAQLSSSSELANWKPVGVVAGILSGTSPLAKLALMIAPALAAGNTICLKPSHRAPLPALLFASIASQAGLPPGVINILPGGGALNSLLGTHPQISKVTFSGPTSVGRIIQKETAGLGSSITMILNGGLCCMIVFDSADLDSAAQEAVTAAWFNQGQLSWCMRRLLIQESIWDKFILKLKDRMKLLRIGSAFDRQADVGSPLDKSVMSNVTEAIIEAEKNGLEVFQKKLPKDLPNDEFFPPTLIVEGFPYSNQTIDEDILLPIIAAQPFRTAKEAITIANNSRYGLAASVWTENTTLAAEVAYQLQVGTVWINSHGTMDASVPFPIWKQSGIGIYGGKEGLLEYMQYKGVRPNMTSDEVDTASFGTSSYSSACFPEPKSSTDLGPKVDCTYKLYYGGAHKRPDSNLFRNVNDGTGKMYAAVPEGSRKDVRNAVEAAVKAQPSWWKLGAHGRSQILYNTAEKLQLQREDFISRLTILYGKTDEEAAASEVDECLALLFHWAANCDKKVVVASETNVNGNALNISREPMGVIGIVQPPVPSPSGPLALLSFIQLFAPAVCYGNAVVVLADDVHPTPSIEFCQVLDTSDFPAGVVNVLTGNQEQMLDALANHQEVSALWAPGVIATTAKYIEMSARHNFKRTWVDKLPCFESLKQSTDCRELFELNSTRVKAVWTPYGEIFAN